MVTGGKGKLETNGQSYCISRGDVFILRTWEQQLGVADPEDPPRVWIATFDYPGMTSQASNLPKRHRRDSNLMLLEHLAKCMVDAFWRCETGSSEAKQWMRAILAVILENDWQARNSCGDPNISALCEKMAGSPGACWALEDMAAFLECSPSQCIRRFRKFQGKTPHAYLIEMRMNMAQTLLRYSDNTLTEIALEVGYSDVFAFSKQFKRITGTTPTRYRKSK
jgi:AraC-like DNA-binding protein